jgi:hypothetical protein
VAAVNDCRISAYLRELGLVCLEVSNRPELLGTLLGILRLAVPTLVELSQEWPAPRVRRPWLRRITASR